MKFAKRLTALLLVVLFCVTAVPVSAAAEATLHVVSGTAKPGETVVVPIRITRIEDVASIGMHVWYDPAVLKCLDAQMSDAVASMDWANANTEPKKHPNEVWLTAISSKPVILDGDVMTITFEVLSSAPSGASPVKILDEGLSISVVTDLREIETAATDGMVTVEGDAADEPAQSTTTATTTATETPAEVTTTGAPKTTTGNVTPTTTKAGDTPATQASDTDTAVTEPTVVTPNGETVIIPEETMVDIEGNVVTDASGNPTRMPAVAVMFDKVTATPGEQVTVAVSLSEVAGLKALGIAVRYDTSAFTFEGGECVGFVKDGAGMANVTENQSGIVDISVVASEGMSGSGEVAHLRFRVKSSAKNGDYRLSAAGTPLLQADKAELPSKVVAGAIRVEGAKENSAGGMYVILGAIALAAVVAVIVWVVLRRKKASAPTEKAPTEPAVVDVSGEDDE